MRAGPWLGMMRQTVSIAPRTGQDQRGKPTYGSATNYKARVVDGGKERVDGQGRLIRPAHTVWIASDVHINPDSQITLSTADVGSTEDTKTSPPMLGAPRRYPDETGRYVHTKIELGR